MTSRVWGGVVSLSLAVTATAGEFSKQPVGSAGGWANTVAAASLGGRLYTVESSGSLYATDPASGTWSALGKPEFGNTAFLFATADALVSIEKDGSLYLIQPGDGSWKQSGPGAGWANTLAGAVLNGTLFTAEAGGALYASDPGAGTWQQIGGADFGGTKFLFAAGDKLVSIEKSGALYQVDPADGSWQALGDAGAWAYAEAGAVVGGTLYSAETDGGLYATDLAAGTRTKVGAGFEGTALLVDVNGSLYGIDAGGNLFRAEEGGGEASAPAAATSVAPPAPPAAAEEDFEALNDPAKAGELTFKFLGAWMGDTEPFEKDPEFQQQMAAAPEMMKPLVDMMKGMKMSVTLDGISMQVMGESAGPFKYSVLAGYDQTLVIENDEGPKQGVRSKIIFSDPKHIQVIEISTEGKAMYFRKE